MRILSWLRYDCPMTHGYIKDFDAWNEYAKKLEGTEFGAHFRAREVWWCSLGANIGGEQDGRNKNFERPALILRRMRHDLALIVPFTSSISQHEDRINFEIDGIPYQVLLSQVRTVSCKRFLRKAGYSKIHLFSLTIIKLCSMILIGAGGEIETPPFGGESRSPKAT